MTIKDILVLQLVCLMVLLANIYQRINSDDPIILFNIIWSSLLLVWGLWIIKKKVIK